MAVNLEAYLTHIGLGDYIRAFEYRGILTLEALKKMAQEDPQPDAKRKSDVEPKTTRGKIRADIAKGVLEKEYREALANTLKRRREAAIAAKANSDTLARECEKLKAEADKAKTEADEAAGAAEADTPAKTESANDVKDTEKKSAEKAEAHPEKARRVNALKATAERLQKAAATAEEKAEEAKSEVEATNKRLNSIQDEIDRPPPPGSESAAQLVDDITPQRIQAWVDQEKRDETIWKPDPQTQAKQKALRDAMEEVGQLRGKIEVAAKAGNDAIVQGVHDALTARFGEYKQLGLISAVPDVKALQNDAYSALTALEQELTSVSAELVTTIKRNEISAVDLIFAHNLLRGRIVDANGIIEAPGGSVLAMPRRDTDRELFGPPLEMLDFGSSYRSERAMMAADRLVETEGWSYSVAASGSGAGFVGTGVLAVSASMRLAQSREEHNETLTRSTSATMTEIQTRYHWAPMRQIVFSTEELEFSAEASARLGRIIKTMKEEKKEGASLTRTRSLVKAFMTGFGSHVFGRITLGGWYKYTAQTTAERTKTETSVVKAVATGMNLAIAASASYSGLGARFTASAGANVTKHLSQVSGNEFACEVDDQAISIKTTILGGVDGLPRSAWLASLQFPPQWRVIQREAPYPVWKLIRRTLPKSLGLVDEAAPSAVPALTLPASFRLPTPLTLWAGFKLPAGFIFPKGSTLPVALTHQAGLTLPAGTHFSEEFRLPDRFTLREPLTLPAGFELAVALELSARKGFTLPLGTCFPEGFKRPNLLEPGGFTLSDPAGTLAGQTFPERKNLLVTTAQDFGSVGECAYNAGERLENELTLPGGYQLPAPLTLPTGFVLTVGLQLATLEEKCKQALKDAGVFVLQEDVTLPAGYKLPGALTLPIGFELPAGVPLEADLTLPTGFKLPSLLTIFADWNALIMAGTNQTLLKKRLPTENTITLISGPAPAGIVHAQQQTGAQPVETDEPPTPLTLGLDVTIPAGTLPGETWFADIMPPDQGLKFERDMLLPAGTTLSFSRTGIVRINLAGGLILPSDFTLPAGCWLEHEFTLPVGLTLDAGLELPAPLKLPARAAVPAALFSTPWKLPGSAIDNFRLPAGLPLPIDLQLPKYFVCPAGPNVSEESSPAGVTTADMACAADLFEDVWVRDIFALSLHGDARAKIDFNVRNLLWADPAIDANCRLIRVDELERGLQSVASAETRQGGLEWGNAVQIGKVSQKVSPASVTYRNRLLCYVANVTQGTGTQWDFDGYTWSDSRIIRIKSDDKNIELHGLFDLAIAASRNNILLVGRTGYSSKIPIASPTLTDWMVFGSACTRDSQDWDASEQASSSEVGPAAVLFKPRDASKERAFVIFHNIDQLSSTSFPIDKDDTEPTKYSTELQKIGGGTLAATTKQRIAAAVFKGTLYCAYCDTTGRLQLISSQDGKEWMDPKAIVAQDSADGIGGERSDVGPALAVFDGPDGSSHPRLYCAYGTAETDGPLLLISSEDGSTWSQRSYIGSMTSSWGLPDYVRCEGSPSLTAFRGSDGINRLYCHYLHQTGSDYWVLSRGAEWKRGQREREAISVVIFQDKKEAGTADAATQSPA